jgi:polyisoprenoid-binding protein YceI
MKQTHLITFATAITAALLVGCSDPADKVHKSGASAAKEEAAAPAVASKAYVVRSESTIGFVGSKVTGSHDGGFKSFEGTVSVADGKVVPPAEIRIAMASTWSDNERLTGHLKSADFFDAEKFPVSTFTITAVEPEGDGSKVTGNLALHGVTNSISFPAKIQVTDTGLTANAEFAINRKDFGINYPGKTDDLIRDNVVIKLALTATPGEARPEDQMAK